MQTTEAPSQPDRKNKEVSVEGIIQDRFVLVKLYAPLVFQHWDILKSAIVDSYKQYSEIDEKQLYRLLQSLMLGKLQVCLVTDKKDNHKIKVALIYSIVKDELVGDHFAVINAVKVFGGIDESNPELWDCILDKLIGVFRGSGANRLVIIASNQKILSIIKRAGFNTSNVYGVLQIGVS